jgi:hypothetical protein
MLRHCCVCVHVTHRCMAWPPTWVPSCWQSCPTVSPGNATGPAGTAMPAAIISLYTEHCTCHPAHRCYLPCTVWYPGVPAVWPQPKRRSFRKVPGVFRLIVTQPMLCAIRLCPSALVSLHDCIFELPVGPGHPGELCILRFWPHGGSLYILLGHGQHDSLCIRMPANAHMPTFVPATLTACC